MESSKMEGRNIFMHAHTHTHTRAHIRVHMYAARTYKAYHA